jgi:hypothetical protein
VTITADAREPEQLDGHYGLASRVLAEAGYAERVEFERKGRGWKAVPLRGGA